MHRYCLISLLQQPALATSLDLRCYLCLSSSQDGTINLNVPDLELKRTWRVAEVALKLRAVADISDNGSTEKQLDLLKDLSGIGREEEAPSTPAVATLVFLFLLVNVYGAQFE